MKITGPIAQRVWIGAIVGVTLCAGCSTGGESSAAGRVLGAAEKRPAGGNTDSNSKENSVSQTSNVSGAATSAPAAAATSGANSVVATFGGGCFWGVEESFRQVGGVTATAVGYMGGAKKNPTYKEVCTDQTGHAEVVHVTYDPQKVSYEALLNVFFKVHDPTQVNRQGPDVGAQYRSVIFFHSPEQRAVADRVIDELTRAGRFKKPIATQVAPAAEFWRAEEYHQQYLSKRGLSNCHVGGP